jgi:hypothetical protein
MSLITRNEERRTKVKKYIELIPVLFCTKTLSAVMNLSAQIQESKLGSVKSLRRQKNGELSEIVGTFVCICAYAVF